MENVSFVVGYFLFAAAATVNWIQVLASRQPGLLPAGRVARGYKALSWTMLALSFIALALSYQAYYGERPNPGAFVLIAVGWALLTGVTTRVRNQVLVRGRSSATASGT